ncbi:MAG: TIGR03905 family TSCPD domain-containing protein [Paludibacteraceae bacterium]|nr:TIGR03905 family TSCPD domain-containing protein [Paludibacteraceae bacterium]
MEIFNRSTIECKRDEKGNLVARYFPQGVCSRMMDIVVDGETHEIKAAQIVGGCPGNAMGISRLVVGLKAEFVIDRFSGTTCGPKPTSCPDQFAQALKMILASK